MPKLLYQGHGSLKLTTDDGRVIFVDPYAGEGYDAPADAILVTHGHHDHNKIELCIKKPDCRIITHAEALAGDRHNKFNLSGVVVEAVDASNKNHDCKQSVGYLITLDGVKIYISGDTSKTKQMETFKNLNLDYAFFCGDGVYNMGLEESAECAELVGAKHNVLIHMLPGQLFSRQKADAWAAPNKLVIEPGQEIVL